MSRRSAGPSASGHGSGRQTRSLAFRRQRNGHGCERKEMPHRAGNHRPAQPARRFGAWAQYDYDFEGGYVKPCSLAGVNPIHHPEIFGDPALAREYGFVRSRDGTWQVGSKCFGQPKPAAPAISSRRPQPKAAMVRDARASPGTKITAVAPGRARPPGMSHTSACFNQTRSNISPAR
jgi:hypothetical protein